jgi:hypothetical protein
LLDSLRDFLDSKEEIIRHASSALSFPSKDETISSLNSLEISLKTFRIEI